VLQETVKKAAQFLLVELYRGGDKQEERKGSQREHKSSKKNGNHESTPKNEVNDHRFKHLSSIGIAGVGSTKTL
jgi:hypothetical protein